MNEEHFDLANNSDFILAIMDAEDNRKPLARYSFQTIGDRVRLMEELEKRGFKITPISPSPLKRNEFLETLRATTPDDIKLLSEAIHLATDIFYSPATNDRAEKSITDGTNRIIDLVRKFSPSPQVTETKQVTDEEMDEFLKAMVEAHDHFVLFVNSQKWDTQFRMEMENILIAYDQMYSRLKKSKQCP